MSNPQQLVQKLWNYCNILRDDALSYGENDSDGEPATRGAVAAGDFAAGV